MGCDILIGTIGTMLQFIRKRSVSLSNIKYMILNEADQLLQNSADIDEIMSHSSFATKKIKMS